MTGDEGGAGVDAAHRLEEPDDLVAGHLGVFAAEDGRADLVDGGQQPVVELLFVLGVVVE
jgi:hypothetical protein